MPTGLVRRALLTGRARVPVPQLRADQGPAGRPGLDPDPRHQPIVTEVLGKAGIETAYCTDNPFLIGPRFANFRRTLDSVKPSFSQGAYRFLNKPFKRPATAQRRSSATCCPSCRTRSRWAGCGRGRLELDLPRRRAQVPGRARHARRDQPVDDLKEKRPFFLGVDCVRPARAVRRAARVPARCRQPEGHPEERGITPIQPFETPYSWVVNVDIDDETIERVRELYAAELTFADEWIGRLMNKLADDEAARQHRHLLHVRPRADARRARHHGQARRPGAVAHLPRAVHDPAPRGQARRARRATTSPRPTTCRARCSRSWACARPG